MRKRKNTKNDTSFKPGVSGNPSGRPKGFGLFIRQQTAEGEELVKIALSFARNPDVDPRTRIYAVEFLADRGWGKPTQAVEHSGEVGSRMVLIFPNQQEATACSQPQSEPTKP